MNENAYNDMPLTSVLKEWMELNEWADPIELNGERSRSQVSTHYTINGQPHRLYFDVDEEARLMTITLYTVFNVPAHRMGEIARILNRINAGTVVSKYSCWDDGEPNPIRLGVAIDIDKGNLDVSQIQSMLGAAGATMDRYGELLATVALTQQSANLIWQDF